TGRRPRRRDGGHRDAEAGGDRIEGMSTRSRSAKPSGRATGESPPELTGDPVEEPAGFNGSSAPTALDPAAAPNAQASRRGRSAKAPAPAEPTPRRVPDSLDSIRPTGDRLM